MGMFRARGFCGSGVGWRERVEDWIVERIGLMC